MASLFNRLIAALAEARGPLTLAGCAHKVGRDEAVCRRTLDRLVSLGMVERTGPLRHRLTEAGRAAYAQSRRAAAPASARRTATLRDRVWSALLAVGKSTIPELLALVNCEPERRHARNAAQYVKALARAGLVMEIRRPNSGAPRYMLRRERGAGPRTPIARPNGVWNPNTGRLMPFPAKDGAS